MPAGDETKQASGANPVLADEAPVGGEVSQRRRRLLKGTLTAPIVLTLYNGAALAITSHVATIADSRDQAVLGPEETDNPDEVGKAVCVRAGANGTCAAGIAPTDMRCDAGDSPAIQVTKVIPPGEGWTIQKINGECTDGGIVITASSVMSLF
jgi:hypothetical protein